MVLFNKHSSVRITLLIFIYLSCSFSIYAQQITGVWKGKIDKKKVEIKIVQKGDSLTGTSYYYESPNNYRRYSIKGYFDENSNSVVWWDDALIEEKGGKLLGIPGKVPLLSVADFNCPGGGEMYLDGKAAPKETPDNIKGPVDLAKAGSPFFDDEWNFVIDNYTVGTNDPDIIDSVVLIAAAPTRTRPIIKEAPEPIGRKRPGMIVIPAIQQPTPKQETVTAKLLTIEEKFTLRKKVAAAEIPVSGDSIELRFYDNAEIDGDSISLFLNNKLLFEHIRLTDKAYTIKLPVTNLEESNELIMVAENLGSIPPNTSYMVAIVGDKRYEAKLASTENTSALIRLKKE